MFLRYLERTRVFGYLYKHDGVATLSTQNSDFFGARRSQLSYHQNARRLIHAHMDERIRSIEGAVLRLLHSKEWSFHELISKLAERKLDEASVKATVFRLSSEGQIEITPEWNIRRSLRR